MFRSITLFLLLSIFPLKVSAEGAYEFIGHHFVASYLNCDQHALTDLAALEQTMINAAKASGAQILSSDKFIFPGNGFTMTILLSESHASIHTYPEMNACFVDLFTCGHNCSAENFSAVLADYLQPSQINKKMLLRNESVLIMD